MTPTPEQVAEWAVECGMTLARNVISDYDLEKFTRFAALVCAWQAEQDAAICKARDTGDMTREDMEARRCAADIRASVKGKE